MSITFAISVLYYDYPRHGSTRVRSRLLPSQPWTDAHPPWSTNAAVSAAAQLKIVKRIVKFIGDQLDTFEYNLFVAS